MIIYLHGFNSTPESHKAQHLKKHFEAIGLSSQYACPALPHHPRDAAIVIDAQIDAAAAFAEPVTLIGSSLGGFYATYFTEKYSADLNIRSVLINPAILPALDLRGWLGPQKNFNSGDEYILTDDHLAGWHAMECETITPSRYLLLVETGDEVLDYRHAVEKFRGAQQIVVEGGDHTLASFPDHLAAILEFSGMSQ